MFIFRSKSTPEACFWNAVYVYFPKQIQRKFISSPRYLDFFFFSRYFFLSSQVRKRKQQTLLFAKSSNQTQMWFQPSAAGIINWIESEDIISLVLESSFCGNSRLEIGFGRLKRMKRCPIFGGGRWGNSEHSSAQFLRIRSKHAIFQIKRTAQLEINHFSKFSGIGQIDLWVLITYSSLSRERT
jgi:hypothetical protein